MRKSHFEIDGIECFFEGYTSGSRWNGWSCPYFTKEVGELLSKYSDEDSALTYDAENDMFVMTRKYADEPEEYVGQDFNIDGEIVHLYAIGAWCWIWSEITDYQSPEAKVVWKYLLEEYHHLDHKQLHEVYYGIVQEINGHMTEKELHIFTDGFMAAYMIMGRN